MFKLFHESHHVFAARNESESNCVGAALSELGSVFAMSRQQCANNVKVMRVKIMARKTGDGLGHCISKS